MDAEEFDVLEWYESIVEGYDELYGEEQRQKIDSLLKLVGVSSLGKLLDAGSGTGGLGRRLAPSGRINYYVGLDLAYSMLLKARQSLAGVDVPYDLVAGDLEYMPFRERCFDTIFSLSVLSCSTAGGVVGNLRRATREGGLLVFSVLKPNECRPMLRSLCEGALFRVGRLEIACVEVLGYGE